MFDSSHFTIRSLKNSPALTRFIGFWPGSRFKRRVCPEQLRVTEVVCLAWKLQAIFGRAAAKLVAFDDGNCFARRRKTRSQGRACLARPDDDCLEALHCTQRAPSMWSLPSFAASSGVFPSWRATM
jgi:hypothetical protein